MERYRERARATKLECGFQWHSVGRICVLHMMRIKARVHGRDGTTAEISISDTTHSYVRRDGWKCICVYSEDVCVIIECTCVCVCAGFVGLHV